MRCPSCGFENPTGVLDGLNQSCSPASYPIPSRIKSRRVVKAWVELSASAATVARPNGGATTPGLWDDVIDLQGRAAGGFGIATVLTAIAGATGNLGAIAFRCGHTQPSTP
jgi:hypothetical protein